MKRIFTGVGSLLALILLVVGVPLALGTLFGNPLPPLDQLGSIFTTPDYTGEVLWGTVAPCVAWLAWGAFALSVVIELPAQLRRVRAPRLPLRAAGLQVAAAALIGATLLLFTATTGASPAQAHAAPAYAASQTAAPQEEAPAADAPAMQTVTETVETQVTVEPGETMWGIAEEQYGAGQGDRYVEIFDATAGQAQPVGVPISDPNLILPGQVLDVPTTVTSQVPVDDALEAATDAAPQGEISPDEAIVPPSAATDAPEPQSEQVPNEAAAPAPTSETADRAPATEAPATSQPVAEDEASEAEDAVFPFWTDGGIGRFVAAGLLGVIGVARVMQRRRALPGEHIAMPAETISDFEMELRAVEAPHTMADIDRATRFLAHRAQVEGSPLPALFAARLAGDDLLLYFREPAALPAPFSLASSDQTAWTVALSEVPFVDQLPPAPYPSLVTLGADPHGAQLLVNLEDVGALHYRGDEHLAQVAMTLLAAELSVTTWGGAMRVTLVGFDAGLPQALGSERLREVVSIDELLDELRIHADSIASALESEGARSTTEARTSAPDADEFAPEIILLGTAPTPDAQRELADLVARIPRVGIAVISGDHISGDWTLTIDSADSAVLEPLGLPIRPQMISDEEYDAIKALLATTHEPAQPGPTTSPEPELDTVASNDIDEPDEEIVDVPLPEHDGPYLEIFGTVRLTNVGDDPGEKRWEEIAAYLMLHPKGVETERMYEDIFPSGAKRGVTSLREMITRTRQWLGADSDGQLYIPAKSRTTPYRIIGARTQWDDWRELVGTDLGATDTSHLVAALKLASAGKPFSGTHDHVFGWVDRTGGIRAAIDAEVSAVAHEVAVRAIATRNAPLVRFAAAVGRLVSPLSEVFWRAAIRAEHMVGDREAMDRVVAQLYIELEAHDPNLEPEPKTRELIDTLRGHGAPVRA